MKLMYAAWFERFVGAMRRAGAPTSKLEWRQHMMDPLSPSAASLVYHAPNAATPPPAVRPKVSG